MVKRVDYNIPDFNYMFLAPKEVRLIPAWIGCLNRALGNQKILESFGKDTGNNWVPRTNPIDRMIDEVTGAHKKFIFEFAKWMNDNIW